MSEVHQQHCCNLCAENFEDLKIRKPAQEVLAESLLRTVPVKVTYTSREGLSALERSGTLCGGGGSLRMTTVESQYTYPAANTTERMKACMREIQENAVLLQGLRRQSNPESAMRALITQAMADLRRQEAGATGPSTMAEQEQPLLMMHPVLEKFISRIEERPGLGPEGGQHVGGLLVDKNMSASLGTREIL